MCFQPFISAEDGPEDPSEGPRPDWETNPPWQQQVGAYNVFTMCQKGLSHRPGGLFSYRV